MALKFGGASRDRTDDPLLAKQVLSQLSYGPFDLPILLLALLHSSLTSVMYQYVHSLVRSNVPRQHQNILRQPFALLSEGNFVLVTIKSCKQDKIWWVWEDLNFRPHPYQGCALTN